MKRFTGAIMDICPPFSRLWIAALIATFALLFSCRTPQQLIDKAEKKDPSAVAAYARDKYPCTELLKRDTTTITSDSLIYIDCPTNGTAEDYAGIELQTLLTPEERARLKAIMADTGELKIEPSSTIRVPVHIKVQTKYIDRWFEDSAKLKLSAIDLSEKDKLITVQKAAIEGQVATIKSKNKLILWLVIILIAAGLFIYLTRRK